MLIESKIKPRHKATRSVTVFGTTYEFKQVPGVPGRYIAEVGDPKAVQALVATGAYAQFTDKLPTATLSGSLYAATQSAVAAGEAAAREAELAKQREAEEAAAREAERRAAEDAEAAKGGDTSLDTADTEASEGDGEAPAGSSDPAGEIPPEVEDAAKTLLSATPTAIKKALDNTPLEVAQAALVIENSNLNPRAKVVRALEQKIG